MTPDAVQMGPAHPSLVQSQYEALRMAAVGEALAPQAGSGLMLFLRRGMWAWARILAAARIPGDSTYPSSPNPTEHSERETVIHVLAQMAMNTYERRAL